ncbi:N-6 DNA methylase [Anabaena sp. FACHB-1237]|uniref:Eco57I restriction-modification methylase domain-containing protein n=1 Tax=Anabaena sp. FACHB-1237 TaxID=2692769 RepID=UPI0016814968|nr:DNA methyltransferase [Anabaena sp. FACHB-1237]MBD2136086.1 N-6 DNA methylase [Anabaena sp. FACHB-1237]
MNTPSQIIQLVENFHQQIEVYHTGGLNETQTRIQFIDPFFEALGWDVRNQQHTNNIYQEVIHEASLKISDTNKAKAPDYSFRIGGARKFFVEAKKPSVNVGKNISAAFQLRRYGWSAKLNLSILTDFEEFSVYDCRIMPHKNDQASVARVKYFHYTEYVEKWQEIYNLFSKEAVLNSALEKFAESQIKGEITVDQAFLQEIEIWRENLAANIVWRNPQINPRELNFAVQMTINRMIFLRICEDREIEPYQQLYTLLKFENIYQELGRLFINADYRYNSGLFHFQNEKGREKPDDFTLSLQIDDSILKAILRKLYPPESPYEFSVIPVEILGQVYEQFLGKVIKISASRQAVVEDKPEVRKAGGVYYTPSYIVDYIIKQTIGKILAGKKPEKVQEITILDPACGSGSFLIVAYQFLLDWYLQQYLQNPQKYRDKFYQISSTHWRLTSQERKRILLTHIYGVDIDQQAVETTKLSLLLKVLEGESGETITRQLQLLKERALPDLDSNIFCGNSLIDGEFYENVQINLLDEDDIYRINVFDWHDAFKKIIQRGGFDAIIGNPPYLRIQGIQEYYKQEILYFKQKYQTAIKRFDLYCLFIEKGLQLLSDNGVLSYICPHKFTHADFGSRLRHLLSSQRSVNTLVSFGNNLIFNQVSTYTGIILLSKVKNTYLKYYEFPSLKSSELSVQLFQLDDSNFSQFALENFNDQPWILSSNINNLLLEKLKNGNATIGDKFSSVFQGIVTGIDEIYLLKKINNELDDNKIIEVFSQRDHRNILIEREIVKPILKNDDVHRYIVPNYQYYCIYPYQLKGNKTVCLKENYFRDKFPLAYQYLSQYREEITKLRIKYKTNPMYWYACHRGRSIIDFESQKIICAEISLGCNMMLDRHQSYHNTTVYSLIPSKECQENYLYWLGLFNSKLMWWFLANTGNVLRGGYFRFKTNYIKPFPIYTINFDDVREVTKHQRMVQLVEQILTLHQRLTTAQTPPQQKMIQQQIKATDRQINQLVYQLYELTDKEIHIVENS